MAVSVRDSRDISNCTPICARVQTRTVPPRLSLRLPMRPPRPTKWAGATVIPPCCLVEMGPGMDDPGIPGAPGTPDTWSAAVPGADGPADDLPTYSAIVIGR